ncbi:MAG: hypothetical protein ACI80V_002603 [Rhodothermales bacterium]|jgi:hypothetical protein
MLSLSVTRYFLPASGLASLLLLAGCANPAPPLEVRSFAWNQDARWEAYEQTFAEARKAGCAEVLPVAHNALSRVDSLVASLQDRSAPSSDPSLDELEEAFFQAAPLVGVCRDELPGYQRLQSRLRTEVKRLSQNWDLTARKDRERLYRLMYGTRAALEEAILQGPLEDADAVVTGSAKVNPAVPSAQLFGVTIQSGDILLSRGGAAASALIARGNDFPGNFSHVAIAHVDPESGEASVVEAHIESGVVPAHAETYLADKKLRILVVRARSDHPAVVAVPSLPHQAAQNALAEANGRHIPYDFAMDWRNHESMFCSEVVFSAFESQGMNLWMAMSRISAPGLARWLGQIGVEHFETHEPSDIVYDPQLEVVAEWANPETLWKDHVDNAVIDVLLEGADRGDELSFSRIKWPLAAVGKGWSWVLNRFGKIGPVPEGMSAASALRIQRFSSVHAELVSETMERADAYREANGYRPPYWDLLELVRDARRASEP